MRRCAKGHEFRGDENYRAKRGWCPVCFKEVQLRYDNSEKGRGKKARHFKSESRRQIVARYNHSDKAADAKARYEQSPKGWLNAMRRRRSAALRRRAQRHRLREAEDS